jgi:hypothetical protein
MSVSKSNENKIAKLAAAGKTDAEIDAAVYGGEKKWSTREISFAARRDAGLIPSRVGSFERIEDVRAADVRAVLAESPTDLRAYALPIVFGFRPTRANVDRLGGYAVAAKRPGRLASGAYRKARA